MIDEGKIDKIERILGIYAKLNDGYLINKADEAKRYGVNERSIQRDIEDIRVFLDEDSERTGVMNTVVYDRNEKGYRLETLYDTRLSNAEILAIAKILLDSRAFAKKDIGDMLDKLLMGCVPKRNQKLVKELIRNEEFHYVEPRHKSEFINEMWDIGIAIYEHRYIEIDYQGLKDTTTKQRRLKPLAIMFSEYYFYLTAFIDDDSVRESFKLANDPFPTIYRIDRIKKLRVLDERFQQPYSSRFEEGEFRKRIQFMYGGKLRTIRFRYSGPSIEAVLDRLPTAKIRKQDTTTDGRTIYELSAEVFGDGIDMWIRSQGSYVEML